MEQVFFNFYYLCITSQTKLKRSEFSIRFESTEKWTEIAAHTWGEKKTNNLVNALERAQVGILKKKACLFVNVKYI